MMAELLRSVLLKPSDLADALGVSVHTVRSWQREKREPDADRKAQLAALLRRHARTIERAAVKLEHEADKAS